MRRTYVISDWFSSLAYNIKRNKVAVILYILLCALFIAVGIIVGINMDDKNAYALRSGEGIFLFLRGERGIFPFFFLDFLLLAAYCLFAASMFFNRAVAFLSLAPPAYRAYVLGVNVTVIMAVYSVSALPMLLVAYIPVCLAELIVLCMLSYSSFAFSSLNRRCSPSIVDIKEYYKGLAKYLIICFMLSLIKTVTLALFGSGLIGIVQ